MRLDQESLPARRTDSPLLRSPWDSQGSTNKTFAFTVSSYNNDRFFFANVSNSKLRRDYSEEKIDEVTYEEKIRHHIAEVIEVQVGSD